MVTLLDQIWKVVNAAGKAVPVGVLCGVMVVMMMMVGAGCVMAEARAGGAWGKACKRASGLTLARARVLTLSDVTCTLEVERGVDDFGSRCVPDEFRGWEGVS